MGPLVGKSPTARGEASTGRDETQEKRSAKAHPSLLCTLITRATGWALPTAAHHDRDSGQGKAMAQAPHGVRKLHWSFFRRVRFLSEVSSFIRTSG